MRPGRSSEPVFRTNPSYDIVPYDRLTPEQKNMIGDLASEDDFYGLCVADEPGLSAKSICVNTALLLHTLRTPGKIPAYVRRAADEDCEVLMMRLVSDGLLEVEQGDGSFVSGALAVKAAPSSAASLAEGLGTDPLSAAAILYGAALSNVEPSARSARMYFFNRLPMSGSIRRRFPTVDTVTGFLGLELPPLAGLLEEACSEDDDSGSGWRMWRSHRRRLSGRNFKLYLCIHFEHLPEFIRECMPIFVEHDVPAFKIARDAYGILRPDKFVAYFDGMEHMTEVARAVAPRLAHMTVQAIPFTARFDADSVGIADRCLAWGVDPERTARLPTWLEQRSWRSWITARLAAALATGRRQDVSVVGAAAFALDRLRMEGVDPSTWTPTEGGRTESLGRALG